MEYKILAEEFMEMMTMLRKKEPNKFISESMQGEVVTLHYIMQHNGDVLPSEISNDMDVSSARVAATLNSLENKGYITRQIDKNDRRRILVSLTPNGKEIASKNKEKIIRIVSKMLSDLGEHDAKEFVRITGKLANLISKKSHCD